MSRKICTKCNIDKDFASFSKNAGRGDGLNGYCKECHRILRKKHYHKNKELVYQQVEKYKKKIKSYIRKIKQESNGCKLCGEKEIVCLDFHHRDAKTKVFSIGQALRMGWSLDKIQEEVNKCDLVCANCHRKIHAGIV